MYRIHQILSSRVGGRYTHRGVLGTRARPAPGRPRHQTRELQILNVSSALAPLILPPPPPRVAAGVACTYAYLKGLLAVNLPYPVVIMIYLHLQSQLMIRHVNLEVGVGNGGVGCIAEHSRLLFSN